MAALGCFGYVLTTPKEGERFTEFYILGVDGKAENYPKQVVLEEPIELIIGIVNYEHEVMSYRINIVIDGIENKETTTKALAHEEQWKEVISFIPQSLGEAQRVEFWLYKDEQTESCFKDPLHLYIDVTEPS